MTSVARPAGAALDENTLTVDDWKALYLVMELFHAVSVRGRAALLPFAQAIVEAEGK